MATLNLLVREAEQLAGIRNQIQGSTLALQGRTLILEWRVEHGLWNPARHALEGVCVLVESIVQLSCHTTRGDTQTALVGRCKSQSAEVATRFKYLHQEARKCLEEGKSISLDVTYTTTRAQDGIKRVSELLVISGEMQENLEKVRQLGRQRMSEARDSISNAQEMVSRAKEKKEDNQLARIPRFMFTGFLGEILDLGGLNEAIDEARCMIALCQKEVESSQEFLNRAERDVEDIKKDLDGFDQLTSGLKCLTCELGMQTARLLPLRKKNLALTNRGLDISVFLGRLAGMSETWDIANTAENFATNILAIGEAANVPVSVQGLLVWKKDDINRALRVIATSPAPPSGDLGDLM